MMRPNQITSLWRNERGAAGLEAAIILPIYIFFLVGIVELYLQYRAQGILDQAAANIAHSISQQSTMHDSGSCPANGAAANDVCVFNTMAGQLFAPLDYAGKGKLSVSVLVAVANPPSDGGHRWAIPATAVENTPAGSPTGWQRCYNAQCSDSDLTSTLVLPTPRAGDSIVVVDTAYRFKPFVLSAKFWKLDNGEMLLKSRAVATPLYGDLRQLRQ